MARIPYADDDAVGATYQGAPDYVPKLNIFRMAAHAPHLAGPFLQLGAAFLFGGSLDPVIREIAILRVGYLSNATYEIGQHERIGAQAGMDAALFAAIKEGPAAAGLDETQRQVVAFVDDVVAHVRASDATFAPLLAAFGPKGAQELTLVTGYYMMVRRFLETFDIELEDPPVAGP